MYIHNGNLETCRRCSGAWRPPSCSHSQCWAAAPLDRPTELCRREGWPGSTPPPCTSPSTPRREGSLRDIGTFLQSFQGLSQGLLRSIHFQGLASSTRQMRGSGKEAGQPMSRPSSWPPSFLGGLPSSFPFSLTALSGV